MHLGGYAYSPYGETRAVGTAGAVESNVLRFIGGYLDTASGLYKLGARYFDPALGRFTQVDPSGQEPNPYAYASCNPINASDPSGLVTQACAFAIAGLVASAIGFAVSVALLVLSIYSVIPSYGASLAVGALSVIGLAASGFGLVLSIGGVVQSC